MLFFLLSSDFLSQKKLIAEADTLFAHKKYKEAAVLYQKISETGKAPSAYSVKLADSYFYANNFFQAEKHYALNFSDTVYQNVPQYHNYAFSAKKNMKLAQAVKLYKLIYQNNPSDTLAKSVIDLYSFYLDSLATTSCFNLDLDYNCILLDASESVDTLAAPLNYLWDFGSGDLKEGLRVEHCFTKDKNNKVALHIIDKATGVTTYNDTNLVINLEGPALNFTSPKKAKQYFYIDMEALPTSPILEKYEVLDYIWDLGTGDFLSGKKIKYKFNNLGVLEVKLTLLLRNKTSGQLALECAYKQIEVLDNYSPNEGKTYLDIRKDAE